MKITYIIKTFAAVMALIFVSCNTGPRNSGNADSATPDSLQESTNDRAFRMAIEEKRPYEEYMPVQLQALQELRDGHPQLDAVDILSQTGQFYSRHGNFTEALELLQEASDSSLARKEPLVGDIRLHGNLGGIYARFGLYDEALRENSLALELSGRFDNADAEDLWRMRSSTLILAQEYDSALACLDMGRNVIPLLPENESVHMHQYRNASARADLFITHPDIFRDSIKSQIPVLRHLIASGLRPSATERLLLGRAYVITGNAGEGLALMEQALQEFRDQDWRESVDWALELLTQSLAETGRGERLAELYPEMVALRDSLISRSKMEAVVGADFKYRLSNKEREAEILREENAVASRAILYLSLALIAGGGLAVVLIILIISKLRQSRAARLRQEETIQTILNHQQILNNTIDRLNARILEAENKEVVSSVTDTINPSALSGEDERNFRRAFNHLHPKFIENLVAEYPTLSSNDELLCMLIYLRVAPADMAASLGITRASLNSARYRIRKKLSLDSETDLDAFLTSR